MWFLAIFSVGSWGTPTFLTFPDLSIPRRLTRFNLVTGTIFWYFWRGIIQPQLTVCRPQGWLSGWTTGPNLFVGTPRSLALEVTLLVCLWNVCRSWGNWWGGGILCFLLLPQLALGAVGQARRRMTWLSKLARGSSIHTGFGSRQVPRCLRLPWWQGIATACRRLCFLFLWCKRLWSCALAVFPCSNVARRSTWMLGPWQRHLWAICGLWAPRTRSCRQGRGDTFRLQRGHQGPWFRTQPNRTQGRSVLWSRIEQGATGLSCPVGVEWSRCPPYCRWWQLVFEAMSWSFWGRAGLWVSFLWCPWHLAEFSPVKLDIFWRSWWIGASMLARLCW